MKFWTILIVAIIAEVIGTTALARSDGFTRLVPSLITVAGYALAFYFLALALREMPTGIVYAIWSGLGIVLITLVAWLFLGQRLDLPAIAGMALIIAGVVVMNVFSSVTPH